MKFSEVVTQTLAWLQRDGRVSYRALKREFDLDDEFLEDLKAELIDAKRWPSMRMAKSWCGSARKPKLNRRIGETEKRRKADLESSVQSLTSQSNPTSPSPNP